MNNSSSKGRTNTKITEKVIQWFRRQSLIRLVGLLLIIVPGALYLISSSGRVHIESVSAASGVLMTTAQVCATLAGFLIVAIVFLYDRRRPLLNDSLSIWDVLDLVFFLTTIVLFVYVALYSIEGLGYTLGRSELDSEVEKYAWTAIMVTKTAIFLLALGFGYLLGFTRGYLKKK